MSNYFGEKIKELREKKNLLLRQIAAHLEADTALISKIEKGDRKASKEQAIKIAEIALKVPKYYINLKITMELVIPLTK